MSREQAKRVTVEIFENSHLSRSVQGRVEDIVLAAILAAKAEERGACAALATNFATTSNTRDVLLVLQEAASADTAEGIAAAIRKRGEA